MEKHLQPDKLRIESVTGALRDYFSCTRPSLLCSVYCYIKLYKMTPETALETLLIDARRAGCNICYCLEVGQPTIGRNWPCEFFIEIEDYEDADLAIDATELGDETDRFISAFVQRHEHNLKEGRVSANRDCKIKKLPRGFLTLLRRKVKQK